MDKAQQEAFVEFVHASSTRLTRLAVLLLGGRQGADDLVQSAYERTVRHWPKLQRDGQPEAYTRRVLANLAIDAGRARARRPEIVAEPPERVEPDATGRVDERMRVLAALRRLPDRQREVLVLRVYADMSEAQTAEVLGCSVGTVKSSAHHGAARLRELLVDHEGTTTR